MAGADTGANIRAFVALDLDTIGLRRVARIADRLRMGSGAPSATWTPSVKIHITLKFMGELSVDAVAPMGKALGSLVDGKKAPRPGIFRFDAFPSLEEARVIAIEIEDPDGDLARLARKVEKIAAKLGVAPDERMFRPHVTLARLKRPYDARRWLRPELAAGADECKLASLTLYRSERAPDGSRYVPLATFTYA
jgi:2'-5' RNA ligase